MNAPLHTPMQEKQGNLCDMFQKAPDRQTMQGVVFAHNRPAAAAQRNLREIMSSSSRVSLQKAFSDKINDNPQLIQQKTQIEAIQNNSTMLSQANGAAAALHQRAQAGTLSASQVQLARAEQSLSVDGLAQLAAGLRGVGNATARPIPAQLQAGIAAVRGQVVQLKAPFLGDRSGGALARGVAAMQPQDTSLSVRQGRYQLKVRLNPWIVVAAGKIDKVDAVTRHNQASPGSTWQFVSYRTLTAAGVNATGSALIGQAWPPVAIAAAAIAPVVPQYSVQSTTYTPRAMPTAFHNLAPHQRPELSTGQAWTRNARTNELEIWRDPLQAPASPGTNVTASMVGSRLTYRSYIPDPSAANSAGQRVLSAYADVAARGSTYPGARNYPMTTSDYYDAGGAHWGRGHGVDHADGDAARPTAFSLSGKRPGLPSTVLSSKAECRMAMVSLRGGI